MAGQQWTSPAASDLAATAHFEGRVEGVAMQQDPTAAALGYRDQAFPDPPPERPLGHPQKRRRFAERDELGSGELLKLVVLTKMGLSHAISPMNDDHRKNMIPYLSKTKSTGPNFLINI